MYIFIGYSSKDGDAAARALVNALEASGRRSWAGWRDAKAGSSDRGEIVSAIRASRALVLLLTPGANESPDVLQEVQLAHQQGRLTVPLMVDGTQPCDELRHVLSMRQQIAWTGAGAAAAALGNVLPPAEGPTSAGRDAAAPTGPHPLPAGESFCDAPGYPEMVVVPRGAFLMGSPESDRAVAAMKALCTR